MAPIIVDPASIRPFADAAAFYDWLAENHASAREIWVRIFKKGSGTGSITALEAVDVVLCWGWIDATRKSFDEVSFLQRYTPRGKKSIWSQVNRDNVARLIEEGRMQPQGLVEVERAKADGRWQAAYPNSANMELPAELLEAVAAVPEAQAMLLRLTAQNRFALGFRLMKIKTEAVRQRKIGEVVDMLARGETFYPNGKGR